MAREIWGNRLTASVHLRKNAWEPGEVEGAGNPVGKKGKKKGGA